MVRQSIRATALLMAASVVGTTSGQTYLGIDPHPCVDHVEQPGCELLTQDSCADRKIASGCRVMCGLCRNGDPALREFCQVHVDNPKFCPDVTRELCDYSFDWLHECATICGLCPTDSISINNKVTTLAPTVNFSIPMNDGTSDTHSRADINTTANVITTTAVTSTTTPIRNVSNTELLRICGLAPARGCVNNTAICADDNSNVRNLCPRECGLCKSLNFATSTSDNSPTTASTMKISISSTFTSTATTNSSENSSEPTDATSPFAFLEDPDIWGAFIGILSAMVVVILALVITICRIRRGKRGHRRGRRYRRKSSSASLDSITISPTTVADGYCLYMSEMTPRTNFKRPLPLRPDLLPLRPDNGLAKDRSNSQGSGSSPKGSPAMSHRSINSVMKIQPSPPTPSPLFGDGEGVGGSRVASTTPLNPSPPSPPTTKRGEKAGSRPSLTRRKTLLDTELEVDDDFVEPGMQQSANDGNCNDGYLVVEGTGIDGDDEELCIEPSNDDNHHRPNLVIASRRNPPIYSTAPPGPSEPENRSSNHEYEYLENVRLAVRLLGIPSATPPPPLQPRLCSKSCPSSPLTRRSTDVGKTLNLMSQLPENVHSSAF